MLEQWYALEAGRNDSGVRACAEEGDIELDDPTGRPTAYAETIAHTRF